MTLVQRTTMQPVLAVVTALATVFALMALSGVAHADHGEGESRGIDRACPPEAQQDRRYADTLGDTHEDAINCLTHFEIVEGRAAGQYEPEAPVHRAAMATFVAETMEVAGYEFDWDADDGDQFDDIEDSVHRDNINKLAFEGLVAGDGEGNYLPGVIVPRGQMASFIVAKIEFTADTELAADADHEPAFDDTDGNVHEDAINALAQLAVVIGDGEGSYGPERDVQRGPMATFVAQGADVLAEQDAWNPDGDNGDNGDNGEPEPAESGQFGGEIESIDTTARELVAATQEGLRSFDYTDDDSYTVNFQGAEAEQYACAVEATLDEDANHFFGTDYDTADDSEFTLSTEADVDACFDDTDDGLLG